MDGGVEVDIAKRVQRGGRVGLLVVGAIVAMLLFAACSGSGDDNNDGAGLIGGLNTAEVAALLSSSGIVGGFSGAASGIHVNGVGVAEASPDIAILSVGVETFSETVTAARDEAANALDAMLAALRAAGVQDDDIETRFFNIQPEYTFQEIFEGGLRRSERKLTGYRVTNTLSVTLRDLDNVGNVIDEVVTAGGDAVRINSISFTLEDGTAIEEQARVLALRDAVAKADLFADETGVERGKLLFISETSGTRFPTAVRLEAASFDGAIARAPTPIIAGSLDVRVSVQAVFAID
jgi:uncharacterized protein YggE